MPPTASPTKTKGLSGYAPELEESIFEFQKKAYPDRSAELIPQRWRWMFVESAHRLEIEPRVWVYLKKGAVLAHQGAIATRLQIAGNVRTTGWFVETMALPEVRGKAIGPMLVKKAIDDLPMNLSLGQTQDMRDLQLAMGWKQIVPLHTYVLLVRPEKVLAEKLPLRGMGRLGGRFVAALGALRRRWRAVRTRIETNPRTSWTNQTIERFSWQHDQLWQSVAPHYPCAVVRDASFLNWKFVDQPGQEFTRLEIRRNEELVAVAIFTLREPDSVYPYRRAWLTDLVVDPTNRETLWNCFTAVHQIAYRQGVDAIVFDITCSPIEQIAREYGFWKRESTRVFLLATGGMSEEERQIATNANNWYLTKADSDIDRP